MRKLLIPLFLFLFFIEEVFAHCPLCTIGAGVAATGAAWFGISNIVIGIFIGAFAIALGLWISKLIKKKYVPYQKSLLTIFSFLLTVFPLLPMMKEYTSFSISILGDYGSLLNRTYLINLFLIGSFIGAIIMLLSPIISKKFTKTRGNKKSSYQGIIITFILLIIVSIILQVLI